MLFIVRNYTTVVIRALGNKRIINIKIVLYIKLGILKYNNINLMCFYFKKKEKKV